MPEEKRMKQVGPEKTSSQAPAENEQWRRTLAKQVDQVVSLIKPKPEKRENCREEVARIIWRLLYNNAFHREEEKVRTKEGARALKKLGSVIMELIAVLKDEDLVSKMAVEVAAVFPPIEDLKRISDTCYRWAETNKPGRGKSLRTKTKAKREAIAQAHALLVKYSRPVAANDAKDKSLFCELAAVLYGDPGANISIQCQEYLRDNRKKSS